MIIGVPKEIRDFEFRVGIVPGGVAQIEINGHSVLVEKGAGLGAGFTDEEYVKAGAEIADSAEEVWSRADMIVKAVKPIESEYQYFRESQIIFSYLHLAASPELTRALERTGITAIAYETIQLEDGSLPLLKPTSEIAGRMAVQKGAFYLENTQGGRGVLLSGVPGAKRGNVLIIGGGVVGGNAAKIAVGMGADVFMLDVNLDRLEFLDDIFQGRLHTLYSNVGNIAESVGKCDLLIGAVLIPGAKAPSLVSEEMVKDMKPGSVIIDVSIDQGGCVETISATSFAKPVYTRHGVIHYGVTNMASAIARTSALAVTNATINYIITLADKGLENATYDDHALHMGVNAFNGHITYEAVAEACGVEYRPLSVLL